MCPLHYGMGSAPAGVTLASQTKRNASILSGKFILRVHLLIKNNLNTTGTYLKFGGNRGILSQLHELTLRQRTV